MTCQSHSALSCPTKHNSLLYSIPVPSMQFHTFPFLSIPLLFFPYLSMPVLTFHFLSIPFHPTPFLPFSFLLFLSVPFSFLQFSFSSTLFLFSSLKFCHVFSAVLSPFIYPSALSCSFLQIFGFVSRHNLSSLLLSSPPIFPLL